MTVATVYIPVSFGIDETLKEVDIEEIHASEDREIEEAESELDELLTHGYRVVSSHFVECDDNGYIVLICFRPGIGAN